MNDLFFNALTFKNTSPVNNRSLSTVNKVKIFLINYALSSPFLSDPATDLGPRGGRRGPDLGGQGPQGRHRRLRVPLRGVRALPRHRLRPALPSSQGGPRVRHQGTVLVQVDPCMWYP